MVRNRVGNRFRYEYKCRSASAPRFRLINTEAQASLCRRLLRESRLVSRRYSGKSVYYHEREGNGIVATVGLRLRGLRLRGIVLSRFRSLSPQLDHFLNEKYPNIAGG